MHLVGFITGIDNFTLSLLTLRCIVNDEATLVAFTSELKLYQPVLPKECIERAEFYSHCNKAYPLQRQSSKRAS